MIVERIFIDAHPDHAAEVMGFVVRELMKRPGITLAKVAGPSSLPTQVDSIVLYADSLADVDWALALLSKYQASHRDYFRPELCAATRPSAVSTSGPMTVTDDVSLACTAITTAGLPSTRTSSSGGSG